MTEDKEGETEKLSMSLIAIVIVIIVIAMMNERSSEDCNIKNLCSAIQNWNAIAHF